MTPPVASPRRSARLATTGSLWIVRHGERADVADGSWWETAERPHDPPLTTLGLRQARATGDVLKGQRIEAVYASPFRRCVQTALQIADGMCEPGGRPPIVKIEPGLGELLHHEWFDFPGIRSGNPVDAGMSTAALAQLFGSDRIDTTYTPFIDATARGGVPTDDAHELCFPEEWHEGTARYEATLRHMQLHHPFAVLVSHGAGVQACGESIPGVDMSEMEVDYCCLTNLTRQGVYDWKVGGKLASATHTLHLG